MPHENIKRLLKRTAIPTKFQHKPEESKRDATRLQKRYQKLVRNIFLHVTYILQMLILGRLHSYLVILQVGIETETQPIASEG